jgi:hypothetical protein
MRHDPFLDHAWLNVIRRRARTMGLSHLQVADLVMHGPDEAERRLPGSPRLLRLKDLTRRAAARRLHRREVSALGLGGHRPTALGSPDAPGDCREVTVRGVRGMRAQARGRPRLVARLTLDDLAAAVQREATMQGG